MTSSPKSSSTAKAPPAPASTGEPRLVDIVHVFTDARIRREYIEMIVFVLILVCFLRLYGAEAYQIPSGSMAPTLLGNNKSCRCPSCGHVNVVNARGETEDGRPVYEGLCQNCQHSLQFARGQVTAGDRVLVDKLEFQRKDPDHWQVAVFKFPDGVRRDPNGQVRSARTNYIKRIVGKPNETVGIEFGDIFISKKSPFEVLRKPTRVAMATRRLVSNIDEPAKDLVQRGIPARWAPAAGSGWKPINDQKAFVIQDGKEDWIEYRHILRPEVTGRTDGKPSLITDFETYNSDDFHSRNFDALGENWVGDLMVEVDVKPSKDAGMFMVELIDGQRQCVAAFDLQEDKVRLLADGKEVASAPCKLSARSSTRILFSDFDDRLLLSVDGSELFPAGIDLPTQERDARGPTAADLRPVRIGGRDLSGEVSRIRLYRDIYYTKGGPMNIVRDVNIPGLVTFATPEQIDRWRIQLLAGRMRTFPLMENQFFVLGDNSPQSADARDWYHAKLVERRLLLGRAVVRYWPMLAIEQNWPVLKWKFVE
ncbi:S26 family signal peptidase [bacterium]|nr:S26 family signal peptidase [bacterium]